MFNRSTKVLLGYVVMYVKIYIWAKWDLGTPGESIRFLQIYVDYFPKLAEYHWLAQPAKCHYFGKNS